MSVESPAFANQAKTYAAEQTRRAALVQFARTSAGTPGIITGGLVGPGDCQLTAPASGMSVNVNTGECIIPGNEGATQGGYYGRVSSQTNLTISAANPTNPRIDLVCATVSDSGYTEPTGGSGDQWAAQVITGTPTSGATLTNLSGKGTLPGSSLLLGYVLVPANATSIISADILNVAQQAAFGFGVGGPGSRGAVNITTTGTRTSAAFGFLNDANDQVTGIVLPTNGLILIAYQATWEESVAGAASAAIFIGSNQLETSNLGATPGAQSAGIGGTPSTFTSLSTTATGLQGPSGATAYTGDVTTGQSIATGSGAGVCHVFAAAGTYTVSVQFAASSGTVTAKNRKLWVWTLPFN